MRDVLRLIVGVIVCLLVVLTALAAVAALWTDQYARAAAYLGVLTLTAVLERR